MVIETCDECGFDGGAWDDAGAIQAIRDLPQRWSEAVSGVSLDDLIRRPLAGTWSIAEYADHVREVLFGMRFVLDTIASSPGTDLGPSPEPPFDPSPRNVEISRALDGIGREATALASRLAELGPEVWTDSVVIEAAAVDPHWICRHAVHDATHHLMDVDRLRSAMGETT